MITAIENPKLRGNIFCQELEKYFRNLYHSKERVEIVARNAFPGSYALDSFLKVSFPLFN